MRRRLADNGVGNQSGVALLAVLALVSVLLAGALELARHTGLFALAAGRAQERTVALERSRAGLELALALLTRDAETGEIDSVQEDWARPDKLARAVSLLGYPKGELILKISDELGRLQVNALIDSFPGHKMNPDQYRIWTRFLEDRTGDGDVESVMNALLDWLDSGDNGAVTGLSGAESDYYLSLDHPYACADGPFTHISELGRVRGMTAVIKGEKKAEGEEGDGGAQRFEDLVTVYGLAGKTASEGRYAFPGRVNVNTAEEAVLRALLPEGVSDQAKDLVAFRADQGGGDGAFVNGLEKGWVSRVVSMSEKAKQALERKVRYDTNLFRARAEARVNGTRAVLTAIILREQDEESGRWQCRMIQVMQPFFTAPDPVSPPFG